MDSGSVEDDDDDDDDDDADARSAFASSRESRGRCRAADHEAAHGRIEELARTRLGSRDAAVLQRNSSGAPPPPPPPRRPRATAPRTDPAAAAASPHSCAPKKILEYAMMIIIRIHRIFNSISGILPPPVGSRHSIRKHAQFGYAHPFSARQGWTVPQRHAGVDPLERPQRPQRRVLGLPDGHPPAPPPRDLHRPVLFQMYRSFLIIKP